MTTAITHHLRAALDAAHRAHAATIATSGEHALTRAAISAIETALERAMDVSVRADVDATEEGP